MLNPQTPTIFRAAMADVWRHKRAAFGLVIWLFVILVAVERRYLQAVERMIFDVSVPYPYVLEWAVTLMGLALVPLIALPWHWLILCEANGAPSWQEAPGKLKRLALYLLHWVIYGLLITLAVVLPLVLIGGLLFLLGGDPLLDLVLLGPFNSGPGAGLLALVLWLPQIIAYGLAIAIFSYLYFRAAMGLPHIAVTGTALPMRQSWQWTAPLHRALLRTALAVTAVTLLLTLGPMWLDLVRPVDFETPRSDRQLVLVAAARIASEIALILGGAAVLSRVYAVSAPEQKPPVQDPKQT